MARNYDDPLLALLNPCQTVINAVVSRMSYQQFMRARKVEGDVPDVVDGAHWVVEFRIECLRELREQVDDYGIIVQSFDVMDRELDGALGKDLEKQAEKVLQNQIEASQVQLKNKIKTEEETGLLAVEQVKAQTARTKADTEYYAAAKAADSKYYQLMKEAAAQVESSALISQQEAKNIVMLAEARMTEIRLQGETYSNIQSDHAQTIQLSLIEVEKRKALPAQTVWFQGGSSAEVAGGFQVAKGVALAQEYTGMKHDLSFPKKLYENKA